MGRIFTAEDLTPITGQASPLTPTSADEAVRAGTPTPLSRSRPRPRAQLFVRAPATPAAPTFADRRSQTPRLPPSPTEIRPANRAGSSFADQRAEPRRSSTPRDLPPLPPPSTPPKQELKSVWEHSPSPPNWKRTVKGAVRKVSSFNLRGKKSKADLKDTPKTPSSRGNSWAISQRSSSPVPPVPPLPAVPPMPVSPLWRTATAPMESSRPQTALTRTTTATTASTAPISGSSVRPQSAPPRPRHRPTPTFLHSLQTPKEGRYRNLSSSPPTTPASTPIVQAEDISPAPAIPPRSRLRPSPTATTSYSSPIITRPPIVISPPPTPTPRRPLPQPPVPRLAPQYRAPSFSLFPSPYRAPTVQPPLVPAIPPQYRAPTVQPPPVPSLRPPPQQRTPPFPPPGWI